MRVLFVAHEDDVLGATKALSEIMMGLKEDYGIEPFLITPQKNKLTEYCKQNNIPNYSVKYFQWGHLKTESILKTILKYLRMRIFNGIAIIKLIKYCKLNKIDLIHTNISVIDIGFEVAKRIGVPHVWHLRESGIETQWVNYSGNFYKKFNDDNNHNIVISNFVQKLWENRGVDKKKLSVIYDGVSDTGFSYELPSISSVKAVLVGSLLPHKGQLDAINAISNLINQGIVASLDIIGSGFPEYTQKLKNRVSELKLNNDIHFIAYNNNIPKLLHNYNVGIVASKAEAFGRVTIEYMLSGLPVVASNTGANSELLDVDNNGLLYEYGNSQSLSLAITNLLNNKIDYIGYSKRGYKVARSYFSIKKNVNKIYDLYIKLIDNKG